MLVSWFYIKNFYGDDQQNDGQFDYDYGIVGVVVFFYFLVNKGCNDDNDYQCW